MMTFACLYAGLATRALGGIHKTHARSTGTGTGAGTDMETHHTPFAPYPTLPNDRALLLLTVVYHHCLPPAHPEATH
jgi:hypothetical protein